MVDDYITVILEDEKVKSRGGAVGSARPQCPVLTVINDKVAVALHGGAAVGSSPVRPCRPHGVTTIVQDQVAIVLHYENIAVDAQRMPGTEAMAAAKRILRQAHPREKHKGQEGNEDLGLGHLC